MNKIGKKGGKVVPASQDNPVNSTEDPLPEAEEIPPKERNEGPPVPPGDPLPEAGVLPPKERIEGSPVAGNP